MASSEDCGFSFTWIIENINYLHDRLLSPKFVANCLHKTEWQLGCALKSAEPNEEIEKYLFLRKVETEPYNISVSYELSVFDAKNEKLQTFNMRGFWFHRGNSVGESKFCDLKKFSRIKTIRCHMWQGTQFCNTEQGFGRTRICIERRHFIWTIERVYFSEMEKETNFVTINSKKYPSKNITLIMYISRICERKLLVEIMNNFTCGGKYALCRCNSYPYIQNCEISVVDSKGNIMVFPDQEKWKITLDKPFQRIPRNQNHDKYCFQFPLNSTNKEFTETCLQNGSVSFHCECDICFGVVLNQLEDDNSVFKECNDKIEKRLDCCKIATSSGTPPSNFMKDMQQLFAEKRFCDFNLKTETEIFPVHRAILGVRSPVFNAIFSHDMKENASRSVDIPDLNADTVRRMLVYIYTDKVCNILWEDAFDLYIAGDKYQLLNLKERCSFILKSNFFPSNVCQILVLADERHDEDLKRAAEDYIVDHDTEIIHLDAWKDIEKNNSNLGIDILRQIVIKRQKV
ncbi:Protein maternal effect lethal 26 [Araneus ventricosus]|uniref:Protein maternal effect lethal 26 n=1 Tax=Araneus ventricosus TaxID=182803 RepID=A0A4Y2K4J9_ARAVE|nr:Protein maternal effect lethal 26 [Araneus ventricosus]